MQAVPPLVAWSGGHSVVGGARASQYGGFSFERRLWVARASAGAAQGSVVVALGL